MIYERVVAIPPGSTLTYAEVARECGAPGAARAVGAAMAENPVAPLIPCHRVVGSDGSLRGYAGGIEMKRRLLDMEASRA
jgi:O-6-methylguanine DNA methyltransferase